MSTVRGQRSDCGTVLTSLTAIVDVVTVMMQESAANQVYILYTQLIETNCRPVSISTNSRDAYSRLVSEFYYYFRASVLVVDGGVAGCPLQTVIPVHTTAAPVLAIAVRAGVSLCCAWDRGSGHSRHPLL